MTLAIYKSGDNYHVCIPNDDNNPSKGNYFISFQNTANPNLYLVNLGCDPPITSYTSVVDNISKFESTTYDSDDRGQFKTNYLYEMVKLYPIKNSQKENNIGSGAGFAISSNGYILTNYHVVGSSSNIRVRGVNNDFKKIT